MTPSGDTTTIAPMLCTESSVSSPDTDVSGVMVATDAPLFRNTSAIRIVASARDLPHIRLSLQARCAKGFGIAVPKCRLAK